MWVFLAAITAGFLFALGSVVQQRAASAAPPEKTLSFALLLWLVRRRLWLAGIGASVLGNMFGAAAIGKGGVALVQPLFTVRLVFALPLATLLNRLRIPARDWLSAIATAVGLAAFIAIGHPHKGHPLRASTLSWGAAAAAVAVCVFVIVQIARGAGAVRAAGLLGTAAGMLFGLQASLTETSLALLHREGVGGMFLHWQPYLLIVAALYGALLIQSAYEMAPLTASFPSLATVEPLVGLLIGVTVLHGKLHVSPTSLVGEIAALCVMAFGVLSLARSPLVTGQLAAMQRRRDEGIAYQTTEEIERLLVEAENTVTSCRISGRSTGSAHTAPTAQELDRLVARAREQLARLAPLMAEMSAHHESELRALQALPARERMTLEPLERELDERQQQIAAWRDRLSKELDELLESRRHSDAR